MRGKVLPRRQRRQLRRITPACAGKRILHSVVIRCLKDHPRMCGEKYSANFAPCMRSGSPPHVRGKVQVAQSLLPILGITPACAGKSFTAHNKVPLVKDHPRMCGEKINRFRGRKQMTGSPPHVRGKVFWLSFSKN